MSEDTITVTDAAANKVWELIQEEGNPDMKLRVFVVGGGCSGFQYGFAFEEASKEGDLLIEKNVNQESAVQVIIDPMSIMYLTGAEIDYEDDLGGERFIIRNNPNAQTTCGCGSSFS